MMSLLALLIFRLPLPAFADGFEIVRDRNAFVSLVKGKDLKRMGITLQVTSDGKIAGRALGQPVSGAWKWSGGYFCRDLAWGKQDLGPNCQAVKIKGSVIRFISDRGTGEYADLRVE